MSKVAKRTFSLSVEQAAYIDAKVATGGYASSSEVVREGLRALQERDEASARWFREEVAPALDRYESDPSTASPLREVVERVKARANKRAS